ncbi:hypothetical protein P7C70_g3237, partial [Phenoliferia sp. Uapishka_3]
MSALFFPKPLAASGSSSAPAAPPPELVAPPKRRAPPRNFAPATSHAGARANARIMREPKSPFVPKRAAGKERDISGCSIEELSDMLERSRLLLNSPHVVSALPGGDSKIRSQQARIMSRLEELKDVRQMRSDLQRTHIVDDAGQGSVKFEDDAEMDLKPSLELMGSSPRTKQRLMDRLSQTTSPNSLMSTISLSESIELQRQAAARDREAAERRQRQQELDAARPRATGSILKDALKGETGMSGFMFHADSDEEDREEDYEGEQEEEEDREALNPYRAAYLQGYERAVLEGDGPPIEEGEG